VAENIKAANTIMAESYYIIHNGFGARNTILTEFLKSYDTK
jgi:hypothetical protein